MEKFEARLKKNEKDIKETKTNVKQILDIFTRNDTVNRAISSQRYNSSRSPVAVTNVMKKGTSVPVVLS